MRGFVIGAIAVAIACGAVGAGATTARSLATDERELWVAAQDTSAVKIMFSRGGIDTIALPSAEKPHTIEFSPSGRYAYVGDVGSGDVVVVRAADRQVVATLTFGSTKSHQVKPSPDGSTVLVAEQTPLKALVKIAADEAQERWTVTAPPLLLPGTPDCTEYTNDGRRAYVSLKPSGIAVVDVATMALLRVLPTAGEVACSMAKSRDGKTIFVGSGGESGHVYSLDTTTDTLRELPYDIRATDLHGLAVTPDGRTLFASSRGSDEAKVIDLTGTGVETVSVDATPGVADRPDMLVVKGQTVYIPLRATGKIAFLSVARPHTVTYMDLAPASANAVHGMALRPDVVSPRVSLTLPRQKFAQAIATGVRVRLACNESCDVALGVVARTGRTVVRRRVSATLPTSGAKLVVIRLPASTKRAFLLARRVGFTFTGRATDGVGNVRPVRVTLVLRR